MKRRGRRRELPRRRPAPRTADRRIVPLVVAAVTLLAFVPVVQNDFVDWDDVDTLTGNPHFRGLSWPHLQWMWTTTLMGHYIPLTWMTFGLDYLVWGMNPAGYHATSLLLHVANACLVYVLARHLLGAGAAGDTDASIFRTAEGSPRSEHAARLVRPFRAAEGSPRSEHAARLVRPFGVRLGAAFAALLFGVHPLRVESVAWATERRDVLCAFFVLSSVLAYLRHARQDGAARPGGWYWASLGLFAAAVLSKSMAVTLPAILVVLDVYPLRRLGGPLRSWLRGAAARLWVEKLPFVLIGAAGGAVAIVANRGNLASHVELSLVERVAVSVYQPAFYLWKTIAPTGLAALYELETPVPPLSWRFVLGAAVFLAVTGAAFVTRTRWPGILAAWIASGIMLGPVSGIVQNGPQIAADRYTYLPTLPWAVLAGAALALWWRTPERSSRVVSALRFGAGAIVVAALGTLTWIQTATWRDSERLWTHALAVAPSSLAHYNLGVHLDGRGRWDQAIGHYESALRIKPDHADAHYNWGVDLARQGQWSEAIPHYEDALRIKPDHAQAHYNWGLALARQGRWSDAIAHYELAVRLKPDFAAAHNNWGSALARQGRWNEAIDHYQAAVRIKPDHAEAHNNWGSVLAHQGRLDEAIARYRLALAIRPDFAEARESLERLLAQPR